MTNSICMEPSPDSVQSRVVAEELLVQMMRNDPERLAGVKLVYLDEVPSGESEVFGDSVILESEIGPEAVIPTIKLLVKRMMDRMVHEVKEIRGDTDHPCEYLILRNAFTENMKASIYLFYKTNNGRWEIHMGHNGRAQLKASETNPVQ